MTEISVKTRGSSSPQGKPRVWFCAHPEDYAFYLEPVSEEILAKQNCAFYYEKASLQPCDTEKLLSELSQINLFVMPVTARLLTTKNRALDVEFAYAVEHHIPVLPLMQEQGLESRFNEACGDLQFLDKNQRDETAISYDEKLEKYLASVLVSDELAEKVRAAFDAYIFLSYRKKDRKYAQELMRLIHENDFCRDIAIWYDEFLTPGENFNDSIAEALKKSKLFALAVTPNLVNEKNYVMTVEYPEAVKVDKTILPMELVSTDADALRESYPGIPACTNAYDPEDLASTLHYALESIALRENNNDPKHNFFIGLAYLSGIDVEVNHKRAVSLLTGAAEAGLPEAMSKLINMYRTGEGVVRDYNTSVQWQKRLVEYRREAYAACTSEDNTWYYVEELWNLVEALLALHTYGDARMVCEQTVRIATDLVDRFDHPWSRRQLARAYHLLGQVSAAEGRSEMAKECYLKALVTVEPLENVGGFTGTVFRRDDSSDCLALADLSMVRGDFAEAEDYLRKAIAIREDLAKEKKTPEARRDLSTAYSRITELYLMQGRADAAEPYQTKGLAINETLAAELKTAPVRRNLSVDYEKMGDIADQRSNRTEAREYYLKSLAIRRELSKETETLESYRDCFAILSRLGNLSEMENEMSEASDYYAECLKLSEMLAERASTVESLHDLAIACYNMASVESGERQRELFCKALSIWEDLVRRNPENVMFSRGLLAVKQALAQME
ncbi:MAG: TIR domain-containing protein [Clostridia bacterium]|nr:TIR domain-containing protein [Clostridia bacterium]